MTRQTSFLLALLALCGCAVQHAGDDELARFVAEQRGLAGADWTELWIVETAPASLAAPAPDPRFTSSRLQAEVIGRLAWVRLAQTLANETAAARALDYALALPRGATVTDFVLRVSDRRIRAIVREAPEAERLYLAARRQGLLTSLVARDDRRFRQRLGEVPAGASVALELSYLHAIPRDPDGWCVLQWPALAAGTAIEITTRLDAGTRLAALDADGFGIERTAPDRASLTFAGDRVPPTVRWRVADDASPTVYLADDPGGGDTWFLLVSPRDGTAVSWGKRSPRDVRPVSPTASVRVGRLPRAPSYTPRSADGTAIPMRRIEQAHRALAQAWATMELEALTARAATLTDETELSEIAGRIREVALRHGVPGYLTAMILVAADTR